MNLLHKHMNSTARNLAELHENQVTLDNDRDVIRKQIAEVQSTIGDLDCKVSLYSDDFERYKKEFDLNINNLTQRIDKAEADRMEKYYRQVAEL